MSTFTGHLARFFPDQDTAFSAVESLVKIAPHLEKAEIFRLFSEGRSTKPDETKGQHSHNQRELRTGKRR